MDKAFNGTFFFFFYIVPARNNVYKWNNIIQGLEKNRLSIRDGRIYRAFIIIINIDNTNCPLHIRQLFSRPPFDGRAWIIQRTYASSELYLIYFFIYFEKKNFRYTKARNGVKNIIVIIIFQWKNRRPFFIYINAMYGF